jgi:hypothetical protein
VEAVSPLVFLFLSSTSEFHHCRRKEKLAIRRLSFWRDGFWRVGRGAFLGSCSLFFGGISIQALWGVLFDWAHRLDNFLSSSYLLVPIADITPNHRLIARMNIIHTVGKVRGFIDL